MPPCMASWIVIMETRIRLSLRLSVLGLVFLMAGCPNIVTKSCEVESRPSGADILVNGRKAGKTPCVIQLHDGPFMGDNFTILAKMDGYETGVEEVKDVSEGVAAGGSSLPGHIMFHLTPISPSPSESLPITGSDPFEVSCDLRAVRVSDGSIIAIASGRGTSGRLEDLAAATVGQLQEGLTGFGKPIAVVSLRNRSGGDCGRIVADELADKVTGGLVRVGRFDVKERVDLTALLAERDLDSAGIVRNEEVRRRLAGVDYVIIGGITVTE